MGRLTFRAATMAALAFPLAAQAQTRALDETPPVETVFDGDHLTVGIGAGYAPSYEGSDDCVVYPQPVIQGRLAGFVNGGYTRLLGDARRTPLTSLRGDADQWLAGAGLAFTF